MIGGHSLTSVSIILDGLLSDMVLIINSMLLAATALGSISFALLACRRLFDLLQQLEECRLVPPKKTSL